MKIDARDFLIAVRRHTAKVVVDGVATQAGTVRDLINDPTFDIPHKRAWFILQKWVDNKWYEYGVSLDLGWLTPAGEDMADRVARTQQRGFGCNQDDRLVFCWTTTGLKGEFLYWHDDYGHHLRSCSLSMRNGGDLHDVAEHELVIFETVTGPAAEVARMRARLAKIDLRYQQYLERMRKHNRGQWDWNERQHQRGTTCQAQ